jgi:DNA polymerase III epsilon subunit-like protein
MPWDPVPSAVTARWLAADSDAIPPHRRVVAIDFETSGFRGTPPNYPTELSAWALDVGTTTPYELFHATIRGASRLDPWVGANTRLTLDALALSQDFAEVFSDFRRVLREGDCIVAHNMLYDWRVIYNYAPRRGDDMAEEYSLRCSYHGPLSKALFDVEPLQAAVETKTAMGAKTAVEHQTTEHQANEHHAAEHVMPIKSSKRRVHANGPVRSRRRLGDLCVLHGVHYSQEEAHGASYDAERLILCLTKHLEHLEHLESESQVANHQLATMARGQASCQRAT